MKKKRFLALFMAAALALSAASCGSNKEKDASVNAPEPAASAAGTDQQPAGSGTEASQPAQPAEPANDRILVIGQSGNFEEKWSPFLAETVDDHAVIDQIFTPICELNVRGELVPKAGSISAQQNDDGTVLYTIKINPGMTYHDGQPVTIDDYIYGLYVRSDPSYAGKYGSLLDSFIEGVENYFYDDPNYAEAIKTIEAECAEKYAPGKISLEDFLTYAKATNLDGWWDGNPAGDPGDGTTWSDYIKAEGFGDKLAGIDAASADAVFNLLAEVEYTNYGDAYDTLLWFTEKAKSDYAQSNLSGGKVNVPEISGIKKVDDLTCTVLITRIGIYDDRGLTGANGAGFLIPKHYYGDYPKGDVSSVLSNMTPMGSGPYIWGGFENNIVTCTANMNYFEGAPKTGTVRWQYLPDSESITALASGVVDITEPKGTPENIESMKAQNIEYNLIDNAGYAYLAMNTQRVPLDVRRGVWSLMNRGPSVLGYYGADTGLAHLIERPMTTTVAEYPADAKEYYPYSRDKAMEYFQKAGYTKDASGKLVDAGGKQLALNVYIVGDGNGDHPAFAMLVQAREDMEALGAVLEIQDSPFNILTGAVNDGTADMWVMAWASVYDCDKSAQFRSTGSQNKYHISDPKMDKLLDEIVSTLDLTKRRQLVSDMLDLSMELCLEFPVYQRKNCIAYNQNNVNMDTIPESSATYDYKNAIWKIEVFGA